MNRIIQFLDRDDRQAVGKVDGDSIHVLANIRSVYELVGKAFESGVNVLDQLTRCTIAYVEDYEGLIQAGKLILPLTHPDPYHTWITGTGLTHMGSASSRDAMHQKLKNKDQDALTDSMKMFQMGLENGKMENDTPASQPEWFYKGNGLAAVNPGARLPSPPFALDGGEEPEIVGLYVISPKGKPSRIGFALGNEFSDHKMEKVNYLYLAHSKLRPCSYGPELVLDELPAHLEGNCRILRNGNILWEKPFPTGEANMSHNFANLEYHHFKYPMFCQPGDVHVHYMGTSVLSFADGITVEEGDLFEISIPEFGKPLVNAFSIQKEF